MANFKMGRRFKNWFIRKGEIGMKIEVQLLYDLIRYVKDTK